MVGWCRWDSDGLDVDLVRMTLELLDYVEVVQGELEVWWEMVRSHVVVGWARDDVGMHMVGVDGWCGKGKVLWI